ncbi:MAG TPA: N-acetylglucosamine-6-phosphate deacetylase [Thermoplasmata archaeon]|nr:N-acetylglucosamine-6-phosphate deacetylase [Thermoplasmata archaeon]
MESFSLSAGKIVTPYACLKNGVIEVEKGMITGIWEEKNKRRVNFPNSTLVPGLIDMHVHGCKGYSVMKGEISEMSSVLASHGVTSFLPTTLTSPVEDLKPIAQKILELNRGKECISQILGLNLEGPWISKDQPGSQSKEHIRKASIEELKEINVGNIVKVVTLAPEENMDIIKELVKRKIIVSLGHSNADYDTAKKAIVLGAKLSTHTFNAMRAFHHRDPGIVGAVLESGGVYCEAIPDLIHLHPSVLKILIKVKGTERVIPVTDGTEAAGLPDGEYGLSLGRVIVKKGACRQEDGTLAGSTLFLDQGIKNLVKIGIDLKDAVRMATVNPATLLGIEDRKGSITVGSDADLVLLNKNMEVERVYVGGKMVDLQDSESQSSF